jgi:glycosyltransferase involved in cell wall biosynthesis
MRIAQITPSAGDSFYCENCIRDVALVRAMDTLGHDLLVIPLYLPLQEDTVNQVNESPIFFGGINVYLQQKFSIFRKTPRWLDSLFDSQRLLRWAGRRAGMTSAKELGQTTISMLQGEHGKQTKELERLIEWLSIDHNKPDIVCLSNVLLSGLAPAIKQELGIPVICMLQDEDAFLDGLPSPYSQQAWNIIIEIANDINSFIAVSDYYAEVMKKRLGLSDDRIRVIYAGIPLDQYELEQNHPEIPTIGYLSRMCHDKGLDTLIEAFIILKKNEKLANTRLRITGGKRIDDEEFINRIKQKLNENNLNNEVEFLNNFDSATKHSFLSTLTVLSVPEKQPVACGFYALESLAAGVPVVEPATGVFPELIKMTGGGLLCEPDNPVSLAEKLQLLLSDSEYAKKLGKQGRKAVFEKFNIEQTAQELMRIYQSIT